MGRDNECNFMGGASRIFVLQLGTESEGHIFREDLAGYVNVTR
jgi:hypothetical protein